ncbi:MAG: hypothetical protein JSW58_13725 [Candidatus Latescibacterota bacterium]|nr:MAG: hypothetical protein JSW58_13725 [Candidatus Latescibacterota bacterium]
MKNHNDTRRPKLWQGLSLAGVGAALAVFGALDADGMWLPLGVRLVFLTAGASCLGGLLLWLVLSTARSTESPRDASPPLEESFHQHKKTILAVIFVIHLVSTLFFFPPRDVFNTKPVVTLDHAFHYYQVHRAADVFWGTGRLHAYDPFFMAGYPSALFDLDVKAAELFCSPFRGGGVAVAFKLFMLLCYLTLVFTVYKGCRYLGLSEREAIIGVLALLVCWHWGRPYASHFRYAGMFGFVCVSHLSVLVLGLFRRFLIGKNTILFFILGPLAFFVHPTAVVILCVPVILTVVVEGKRTTLRRLLLLFLWCVCVVAVNAVWVVPFFEYAHTKTASEAFFQTAGLSDLGRILFRPSCLPVVLFLGLVIPGVWQIRKQKGIGRAGVMLLPVIYLLLLTAYGVRLPGLRHLEPGRFLLSAIFFAAPLAGPGGAWVLDVVGRWVARRRIRAFLQWSAVATLAVAPLYLSLLSARTGYKHRISTNLSGEVRELIDAVNGCVDTSGRLMIEDGPAALYGETHLPGVLPVYTGVEQIGGPYPFTFLQHHFATFQSDKAMGRPISSMAPAQFWGYLDLYNIGWIVTATGESRDFVSRFSTEVDVEPLSRRTPEKPLVETVWKSRRYTLWQVNRLRSFTGSPGDRVRATFNRIEVELETVPERFLLRYHWDEGLVASPPARVNRVFQLDDPTPFLLVEPNGASSITIEY